MFTYDKHLQSKISIFEYYKKITLAKRSLSINKGILLDEIKNISTTLSNAVQVYDDFKFDKEKFEYSLDLPKSLFDLREETPRNTEFEKTLKFHINSSGLFPKSENPNIKNNFYIIGESDSQDIIDKIYGEILPNVNKAHKYQEKIWTIVHSIKHMNEITNKTINNIVTVISKGTTPAVGVCNMCRDFKCIDKKNNLVKRLNKYNSNKKINNDAWW